MPCRPVERVGRVLEHLPVAVSAGIPGAQQVKLVSDGNQPPEMPSGVEDGAIGHEPDVLHLF